MTTTTKAAHTAGRDGPPSVDELIERGALFVVNHSGGKDSQAMMIKLLARIPARQLLVVHACLGEVEWPGARELAEKQAHDAGVPFIVARAVKTFFEMVERRFSERPDAPSWPSAKHRQCTSDLKRGPIEREVRRYAKAKGFAQVVNCMGLRLIEFRDQRDALLAQLAELAAAAKGVESILAPFIDAKMSSIQLIEAVERLRELIAKVKGKVS